MKIIKLILINIIATNIYSSFSATPSHILFLCAFWCLLLVLLKKFAINNENMNDVLFTRK